MCADRAHELARAASPPLGQWEAVIEPSIPEGPALLGFVAARIAEEVSGPEAYHAERARQTEWLVEQLGLEGERAVTARPSQPRPKGPAETASDSGQKGHDQRRQDAQPQAAEREPHVPPCAAVVNRVHELGSPSIRRSANAPGSASTTTIPPLM